MSRSTATARLQGCPRVGARRQRECPKGCRTCAQACLRQSRIDRPQASYRRAKPRSYSSSRASLFVPCAFLGTAITLGIGHSGGVQRRKARTSFPCTHLSAWCRADALLLCGVIRQRVLLIRAPQDEQGAYFALAHAWLQRSVKLELTMDVSGSKYRPWSGPTDTPLIPCSVGPPCTRTRKEKAPAESWGALKWPTFWSLDRIGGRYLAKPVYAAAA